MKRKWLSILKMLLLVLLVPGAQGNEEKKECGEEREIPKFEAMLSTKEKQYLLAYARNVLDRYLKEGELITMGSDEIVPIFKKKRGCFVTLTKNGKLRGCIGYLQPRKPLCDCVTENAINAAVNDRRFETPVSHEELGSVSIEISVLSVPEKLEVKDRKELPRYLIANRDGVVMRRGWNQSTYLPQVWEHFQNKEDFLDSLCRKGGMPEGCWKDADTEIFTYQAEVFHEKKNH